MKTRKARLPEIIDILTNNAIGSQLELTKLLARRGHIVTQATLSRDLKMLRATKISTDLGGYRYIIPDHTPSEPHRPSLIDGSETLRSSQHPAAYSLQMAGNLVVIKTRNGYASGLAFDIDQLKSPHILGTISGADTVFAVVNEHTDRPTLYSLFCSFLPAEVMASCKDQFE